MMGFISVPVTTAIVFYFIYRVFELFVHRAERIMYINKMQAPQPVSLPQSSFELPRLGWYFALRAGCLITGLGVGMLLAYFICWCTVPLFLKGGYDWRVCTCFGSCTLLCGGLGLIISYVVEQKNEGKAPICHNGHDTDCASALHKDNTADEA